jgi:hypothetical protein
MAEPTTREEFKDYCLRRLGKPVVEINVDDDQVEDRLDDALAYYRDYHYDGSEKDYVKHQLTANNVTNKYIEIPESIMSVVNVFPIGTGTSTNNMFSVRYQLSLNEVFDWSSQQMAPYVMTMERLSQLEQLLIGMQPIRHSRHKNRLMIDTDWTRFSVGEYVIIECYRVIDPEVYPDVWKDWWLKRYATAQIKRQWGSNMSKFEGMQLPGGVMMSGLRIYQEAVEEINDLEKEMITSFSLPVSDMIG